MLTPVHSVPQTPPTCFPLVYEVVLTDALSSNTSVEVNCSCNATAPEELAVPGLGENALYIVSLSARNHFQFSVDNPVQATAFSVGEGSYSTSSHH